MSIKIKTLDTEYKINNLEEIVNVEEVIEINCCNNQLMKWYHYLVKTFY